jgi:YHS domain-containing protein
MKYSTLLPTLSLIGLLVGCATPSSTPSTSDAVPSAATESPSETIEATSPDAISADAATDAATETDALPTVALKIYADDGIALGGTDPVAYFEQGQPVEGTADFEIEWAGVTWRFANAEHRDRFLSNPEQYAPQYGGFCAWAVAEGYTAPTSPDAWAIVDDKLYLNYDQRIQARWQEDVPGNIERADTNWPTVATE